jgi:hypothetical protein
LTALIFYMEFEHMLILNTVGEAKPNECDGGMICLNYQKCKPWPDKSTPP